MFTSRNKDTHFEVFSAKAADGFGGLCQEISQPRSHGNAVPNMTKGPGDKVENFIELRKKISNRF